MNPTNAGLRGRVLRVEDLTGRQRDQMHALMETYFTNVTRAGFEADLEEKSWVCTLDDADSGEIRGFSTLMQFEVETDGHTVSALFSGDTIVDRRYWGQQVMHRVMGQHMLGLAEECSGIPTFWLLLSSGYKTYRFLPAFFVEFFPRFDAPSPRHVRQLMDALAGARFGSEYHEEAGIVRFERPAPLRPGVAGIDDRRLRNPHVAFFLRANPGHAAGDELVCIAELSRSNLTPAAVRMIGIDRRRAAAPDRSA